MIEMFSAMARFPAITYMLIVGVLVSLCAALLGVSLVLKRYSMIGDGLSHVGFGALAIASVMNIAPMAVAIPVVVAAAFILLRLSDNGKIKGDAAIAMLSTGALAIGVMANSLSGANIDLESYLFGTIVSVNADDALISIILAAVVLTVFVLFYTRIFAVTFDESFARATGTNAGAYNLLIALLTAVTIVVGMKLLGSMLISSLIIFPSLCAMRVFKSFRSVTICSAVISVVSVVAGMSISFSFEAPCGASIVCVNLVIFALFFVAGKIRQRNKKG
ncbi:MAG: metal ABC transporter permease [Ruminococcaceae bacterium]|nr:metal ABC transporter permease [Oscillospiraceae bacterium]